MPLIYPRPRSSSSASSLSWYLLFFTAVQLLLVHHFKYQTDFTLLAIVDLFTAGNAAHHQAENKSK